MLSRIWYCIFQYYSIIISVLHEFYKYLTVFSCKKHEILAIPFNTCQLWLISYTEACNYVIVEEKGGFLMPLSIFLEMTLSAILTVWSPGPNNILLLSSASKYGVKRNLRFMTGIWSGSFTLMCLSGLFCSTLGKIIPGIQPVMKCLGAAYILYLSWQTWRRLPPSDKIQEKEPTWLMGFFLQLINVKIIIYGLTMFSAYILPYESSIPLLFLFAIYLMFLGALGNLIWAFAGNVLKRFYAGHYQLMNGIMALLLVWCALRIIGLL